MNKHNLEQSGLRTLIDQNASYMRRSWKDKGRYTITSLLKWCDQHPFDAVAKAKECSEKYFDTPGHKYYRMTPEEIILEWEHAGKISTTVGSSIDRFADAWLRVCVPAERIEGIGVEWTDVQLSMPPLSQEDEQFIKDNWLATKIQLRYKGLHEWLMGRDPKTELVMNEMPLVLRLDGGSYVVGRADLVLKGPSGQWVIIDFKTTSDLSHDTGRWDELMAGPYGVDGVYSTKLTKYFMQLQFYKLALKQMLQQAGEEDPKVQTCIVQIDDDGIVKQFMPKLSMFNDEKSIKQIEYLINATEQYKAEMAAQEKNSTEEEATF